MEERSVHRIDESTFTERLQALYLHWRQHKDEWWGSADFIAIATPPCNPDDICYLKSSTLHVWLLGYEFPETVMVFGDKQIHFLCNQNKARLLEPMKRPAKEAVDVDVVIHTMLKGEDGTSKMDDVIHSMQMSRSDVHAAIASASATPIVGYIGDESPPKGLLSEKWADKLNNSGLQLSDVTNGLSNVFAINDPDEVTFEKDDDGAELVRQKNEENASQLASGDKGADLKTSNEIIAYRSVNDLPQPLRQMMIQVDVKKEVVLVPIYGIMVPFHLATVRRVSSLQGTNDDCYLRIIFKAPFTPHERAISVKEASFRSKDSRHISKVVQQIKKLTLGRNAIARESESAERLPTTVVSQADLVLVAGNKYKPIRLSHLCIHPPFGGPASMVTGLLEAHVNGFRYSTSRQDEKVDVMYANIKHAFYQPEEMGEMDTLLHLHLHNHIVVGNKKTKDVQFFMEEIRLVETPPEGEKRWNLDLYETKRRINMEFQDFVNKVHDLWLQPEFKALDLQFEQPLEEHGFLGRVVVPYNNNNKASSAFVVPTSSCLVELKMSPFLSINLSEIEIVNLERIRPGQKDFDMVIVFKDFKRDVIHIDSITSWSFNGIKAWLHTTDIEYFESRVNLHWRAILKTFIDDPQAFIDLGGWGFLIREGKLRI